MRWLKDFSKSLPEAEISSSVSEVSFDEMWHFLGNKKRKLWIWRAVDRVLNRTIGWFVGSCSASTFRQFFKRLEHLDTVFYTDAGASYSKVIPQDRHIIGKKHTVGLSKIILT